MCSVIRQLKVAHAPNEIEHLLWSNQFDLVALSNIKGEVALHRLLWPKVWDIQPPKEQCKVTALAWRPDGKVISIGYTGGELLLVSVENKCVLHTLQVDGEITCIQWSQEKKVSNPKEKFGLSEEQENYTEYVDFSQDFVPKPPNLTNYEAGASTEEANASLLHKQKCFNLLLIGTDKGMLYMSIFGSLSCGAIDLREKLNGNYSICNVHMSEPLDKAIVSVKDENGAVKLVFVNTEIFRTHMKELFCLAIKRVEMQTLFDYLQKAISNVMETWETILLEIDAKLSKYASKVPPGTLSTDFLELLMFGICTDDMQEFLFNDMTKRGLEKFGQNIEMSYINIQKLLLKNITNVGQNLTFHLSELRGMARHASRYSTLGLEETRITEAISANGSFLIKAGEMQQIINNSMVYYKTFFRWLYSAIINLLDEQVPPEVPSLTQQDLAYIAEFLQYFDRISGENNTTIGNSEKHGFIMERLGQYLADRELSIVTTSSDNDWDNFLAQNECVPKHPSVIKHHKRMSLIQQSAHLQHAIDSIFYKPEGAITQNMHVLETFALSSRDENVSFTGINASPDGFMYAFPTHQRDGIYFLHYCLAGVQMASQAAILYAAEGAERYAITDVQFYTEKIISVLMEDRNKQAVLMQCSISQFLDQLRPVQPGCDLAAQTLVEINVAENAPMKSIGMNATKLAVSGCRSVSIVLGDNRKKVITFEMEAEEDEEDDADMTSSTLRESDASMQENSDAE